MSISIANLEKAHALIGARKSIAAARWNSIAYDPGRDPRNTFSPDRNPRHLEAVDDQLAWAIEEYRKRRLDEIDRQLRELGVDPTTVAAEPEKPEEDSLSRLAAAEYKRIR